MEQVGSSASKDRYQLSTTSGASTGEQGRLEPLSTGPSPLPPAVPADQARRQSAQPPTNGRGGGGDGVNGWLTRSVTAVEEPILADALLPEDYRAAVVAADQYGDDGEQR